MVVYIMLLWLWSDLNYIYVLVRFELYMHIYMHVLVKFEFFFTEKSIVGSAGTVTAPTNRFIGAAG